MGFCLISSASALDIDDSDLLSDSNDLSSSSISSISDDISSSDSNGFDIEGSDFNEESSELSNMESENIGSSNENSQNEVLSTDYTVEDSDLDYDLSDKNSKNVLGSSTTDSSTLEATAKTSLVPKSYTVYRGHYFSVTLKSSSGKTLANQKVGIKINDKVYNVTTNSNGVASLQINLKDGKYPILCTFAGTSSYKASSLSLNLTVSGKPTVLKETSATVMKGNSFSVTLKDNSGNVLANQKVGIKINNKVYYVTTNSNGVASLTINLNVNKYPIVCTYDGSNSYKSSKLSLNLSVVKNPNGFSLNEIKAAATNVKAYVLKNKKLPSTVTVGSRTLKISEFSYLASKAINNINSKNPYDIILLSGISNCGSSTHSLKSTIYKAQYVDLSKRVESYVESKKVPPTYGAVKNVNNKVVGYADFSLYTFAFSKVLAFHKTERYLPNYCTFDSSDVENSVPKKSTSLKVASTNITRGDAYKVTLVDASGNKLSNQKVSITINGKAYSKTTDSNGVAALDINLAGGKYSITSAYEGSKTYQGSKVTNTITVRNSSSRFYLADIEAAAANVKSYVNSKGQLPTTVTVANTKLSIAQFSYLMSKAVYNINAGSSVYKYITLPSGISKGNSSGNYLDATVYKAQYVDLSKRVGSYVESNKVPPVYAKVYSSSKVSLGNAEFDLYTFAFAKILYFHKTNGYLPNYCTFQSSAIGDYNIPANISSGKIKANSSQFKNGLNEKNTETNLTKYLVGKGQSTITTSISNLANRLTKGLNSTDAKALAIYNYVRDEIDYSYYADSRYGASGTLSQGSGNCVDQASLVVALCRASGIPARYSHAQGCTFSSGLVTGHVWAQILVNGVWYSADATSVRNSLGNIKNWNTNSYYSLNKYALVPF